MRPAIRHIEPEDDGPLYGLTKNLTSHNPFEIAFHEWADILRDIRPLGVRPGYLFGPPGWSHDVLRKTTAELRRKLMLQAALEEREEVMPCSRM